MPNWKKVIVSGSNAEVANLNAQSYTVLPTGSGSVPSRSYPIPFIDTSGVEIIPHYLKIIKINLLGFHQEL